MSRGLKFILNAALALLSFTLTAATSPASSISHTTIVPIAAEETKESGGSEGSDDPGRSTGIDPDVVVDSNTVVLCVMTIISAIVLITILFEMAKDAILESASEHVRPIVLQMFQELTILGFLSLVVFFMAVTHWLQDLSALAFGPSEEAAGYLGELVETTHYIIFLTMILNIIQVVVLV